MRAMTEVLQEVDRFFMGTSKVHEAARAICQELRTLNIPFAIVGALAANAHGHRRTTEDVDILLTPEGLAKFKAQRLGLGWVEKFVGSRGMRDTRNNVAIDVVLAGDYPGDGRPKDIAFPNPEDVTVADPDGLVYLNLKTLIELKTASGMTAPHRMQDLADVMNLIRVNQLPQSYGQTLHPFVQEKYCELWGFAQIREE